MKIIVHRNMILKRETLRNMMTWRKNGNKKWRRKIFKRKKKKRKEYQRKSNRTCKKKEKKMLLMICLMKIANIMLILQISNLRARTCLERVKCLIHLPVRL